MSNQIAIKVCGLLNQEEVSAISQLPLDYVGLIFAQKSPRCFQSSQLTANVEAKKVGVFVNATLEAIEKKIEQYQLDAVQLHGDESPELCRQLQQRVEVFKAISIFEPSDFQKAAAYDVHVDQFLFDTGGKYRGGNGTQFNWTWLDNYTGKRPFFLSGGIGPNDAKQLQQVQHPRFAGIDLNSQFEYEPGIKDRPLIKKFIHEFKQ